MVILFYPLSERNIMVIHFSSLLSLLGFRAAVGAASMLQAVYGLMKSHGTKPLLTFYRACLHVSLEYSNRTKLSRLLKQFLISQEVEMVTSVDYTSTQIFHRLLVFWNSATAWSEEKKLVTLTNPLVCEWSMSHHLHAFVLSKLDRMLEGYFVRTKLSAIFRNDLVLTAFCFPQWISYSLGLLSSVFGLHKI